MQARLGSLNRGMINMDEHKHNEIQMTQFYVKADVLSKNLDDPEIVEMIGRDMSVYSNPVCTDSFDEVSLCTRGAAPSSCPMCKPK